MASEKEGQKAGGGGAVNDLTPPGEQTMKYTPNDQKTIQQAPPSGVQQNTVMQPQQTMPQSGSSLGGSPISKPPSSLSGKGSAKSGMPTDFGADVALAVDLQDLTGERLLMAAPRMESHGQQCPALNSIPLLAKIGQGGMGAVYYGIHPRLRSEVAVKVLPFHLAEQDPGMIRRFFREAQIAAQVRSPHLCNVMDVNEEAGLFFLVMEFVTGCTAGQYLKALTEKGQQGMPEKDVLDLIIAATEGLWAAHAQGVVHRDIKPDNIMIPYQSKGSKEYDLKRAKLMDLGLARSEESNQSLTGAQSAMGTPGYMAPEQAMDAKTADKRSDVFSMGATIYCLLAGRPPFKAETIMKVLMATMHEPHEPIIKHRPDVSPMLNEILERTLAKKQDQRFADAKQLNTALEDCRRLISGEGGAGAFSGAKTFTYASTPGSGTQDTFMNAGKPAAAGAPKSKGMMYIAAGVAVLALGGGAAVMLKKNPGTGPKPGDGPAVVTPDGTGETGKPLPPIDEQTATRIANYKKYMIRATDALEKGQVDDANDSYGVAKDIEDVYHLKDYPDVKTLRDKYQAAMKRIQDAKDFEQGMKAVEELSNHGKYHDALLKLTNLKPPDDKAKKLYEAKETSLSDLDKVQRRTTEAQTLLDEASKLGGDKLGTAMEKVAEVKRKFPNAADEMNKKAVALEAKLNALLEEKQTADRYDVLMKDAKAAEDQQQWETASKLAGDAFALLPARPEAPAALKRVGAKLSDEDKLKVRQKLDRDFAEAMAKATEFANAENYEKADEFLGKALGFNDKNELALALKTRIETGKVAKKEQDTRRQKTEEFNTLIKSARAMLDAGNFKDAGDLLGTVDPQFKAHADVTKLSADISKKQTEARAKDEYAAQVKQLRDLVRNHDVPAAQKLLDTIEKNPLVDASIKNVKADLLELVEQQKTMQGKDAAYGKLLSEGDEFAKTGDSKTDPADKLASYRMALPKYIDAKGIKPGTEIDGKVSAIQAKINKAKADDEQAQIAAAKAQKEKQEREAREKFNRNQFDEQIKAASNSIKTGDFVAAQGNIDEASKLFKDDPLLKAVIADLNSKRAESDKMVNAALDSSATKATNRKFEDALADLQTASKAYPQRRDLGSAIDTINQLKQIDGQAVAAVNASKTKVAGLDAKAGTKGKTQRAGVTAAQDRLSNVADGAISSLAKTRFQDATLTIKQLSSDLYRRKQDLDSSIASYEDALKEPATSTTNQGDNDPFKDNKKTTPPPKRDDPKPNKNSGKNAGDVNPFD